MVELWIHEENGPALLLAATFVLVLICASASDVRTGTIPNRYSATVLFLSIASAFAYPDISISFRCMGAVCVSVPMLLLGAVYPGAFGGGDIKLMAACGMFFGWKYVTLSMGIAILTGGAACIWMILTKQKSRKERFIFGPFLCIGSIAVLLWGGRIWEWLTR